MTDEQIYKKGDEVKILKGPPDKIGKIGVIQIVMTNGVIVKLNENLYTPVKFGNIEIYER